MTATPGKEGDDGIDVPFDAIGRRDAGARVATRGFPRTARLLSAAEFATMFRMRPLKRSEHFVVYARPREVVPARSCEGADTLPDASAVPTAATTTVPTVPVPLPGRMGLVLGKKAAPRAATRNMVRRALRETFRQRKAEYDGWDLLIRMHARFDRQRFPGAASPALQRACRAEVVALLDEAGRHVARRRPASPG